MSARPFYVYTKKKRRSRQIFGLRGGQVGRADLGYLSLVRSVQAFGPKGQSTNFPYRVPEWDNRPCWRRRRQCQSWVSRADPKFIITGFGRSFKQLQLASTFCPLGANLFLKNEDLTLCRKAFFLSLKIFLTFFDGVG